MRLRSSAALFHAESEDFIPFHLVFYRAMHIGSCILERNTVYTREIIRDCVGGDPARLSALERTGRERRPTPIGIAN